MRPPHSDKGQHSRKYSRPTMPKTISGLKVWFDTIWPARVSSIKPTMAASEVPFSSCTRKPMVAGSDSRNAWGRMMSRIRLRYLMPRACAASDWPRGTAWMAPRQISPR